MLQDYRPLAERLEWELGQEYLRRRGSLAFIGDHEPVPFLVNNDSNLSIKAAEGFVAFVRPHPGGPGGDEDEQRRPAGGEEWTLPNAPP